MRRRTLLTWSLGLSGTAAQAEPPLRIGSWVRSEAADVRGIETVLQRAYAELNRPVRFEELPIRRALQELLNGELDGNLYRVPELIEGHADLIALSTPLQELTIYAYSRSAPIDAPQQWSDLAKLRVGHLRGVLFFERFVPASARRLEASSLAELFRMVEQQHVHVALTSEAATAPVALPRGGRPLQRIQTGLPLMRLHHVLLRRHAAFAAELDALLARWKASGMLGQIRQQAMGN